MHMSSPLLFTDINSASYDWGSKCLFLSKNCKSRGELKINTAGILLVDYADSNNNVFIPWEKLKECLLVENKQRFSKTPAISLSFGLDEEIRIMLPKVAGILPVSCVLPLDIAHKIRVCHKYAC